MMNKGFIAQCEQEQLHLSGAIQPHGCLLLLNAAGAIVVVSDNVGDFLGESPRYWLGLNLPSEIEQHIPASDHSAELRMTIPGLLYQQREFDLVVQITPHQEMLLELTPAAHTRYTCERPRPVLLDHVSDIQICKDKLVQDLFEVTGFERVLYYRLRDDDDGEVVAEARQEQVYGTYLGLRFPASDIPQIARQLYMLNPWRLIPDARVEPIHLTSYQKEQVDLSRSDLRSVSSVHRVYLANMGVVASLSFPVVVGGKLRALVACHHSQARTIPLTELNYAAELVRLFAMQLTAFQAEQRIKLVDGLDTRFKGVREILDYYSSSFVTAWPDIIPWLVAEFGVDGVIACAGEQLLQYGETLEANALLAVDSWFQTQTDSVVLIDSLRRRVPGFPLSGTAGMLAIKTPLRNGGLLRLYFCRSEFVHEISWGGNPEKPVQQHDGVLGIAPRHSFEKWIEKRMGYCRPWTNESRIKALKLRELLVQYV